MASSRKRPKLSEWGDGNVKVTRPKRRKAADWGDGNVKTPRRSGKAKSSCFVATAAFQNEDHPTVRALRKFRDERLLMTGAGLHFIRFYYQVGPLLARIFCIAPWLRSPVRYVLSKMAQKLSQR
jgi:hypothetical protein